MRDHRDANESFEFFRICAKEKGDQCALGTIGRTLDAHLFNSL
jgi:hypothetical protein